VSINLLYYYRVLVLVLTNHLLSSFLSYISGTVAVASGKDEAINTNADRRLLHGQHLRDVKKKKDNRRVAIPQSQDNDNEPGEDSAAKHVETKPIRQEHVEPDSGVLDETIARNLAPGPPRSPSKVLLCHYDEEEGVWKKISISEKALPHHLEQHKMDALPGGTILTSDCEAQLQPTITPSFEPSQSGKPSFMPSESPSVSAKPSSQPSENPSISNWPTGTPSFEPSQSGKPSAMPSESPSVSAKPSSQSGCPGGSPGTNSVAVGECCETDAQCYSESAMLSLYLFYIVFVV